MLFVKVTMMSTNYSVLILQYHLQIQEIKQMLQISILDLIGSKHLDQLLIDGIEEHGMEQMQNLMEYLTDLKKEINYILDSWHKKH